MLFDESDSDDAFNHSIYMVEIFLDLKYVGNYEELMLPANTLAPPSSTLFWYHGIWCIRFEFW